MIELATLEQLKQQCRVDDDNTVHDALMHTYLEAASAKALSYIGHTVESLYNTFGEVPADIVVAVLQIAAHMYAYPEGIVPGNMGDLGVSVERLLNPYVDIKRYF